MLDLFVSIFRFPRQFTLLLSGYYGMYFSCIYFCEHIEKKSQVLALN